MGNSNQNAQSGNVDRTRIREFITLAVRLAFFALSLLPLGALLLSWVTLDGTQETHTGIETVALLAAPISPYLFEVAPLPAAALIIGTALIALLSMLTAYNYHRRKSIYWAPCAMVALAAVISFGTGELVEATHAGPTMVLAIAVLLIIHQTLIRAQVALRRKGKLPMVYRILGKVAGCGHYRWRDA